MALLDIPLDTITERDLLRLIEAGAAESVYIDYKQQTFGGNDGEHAEFLADLSSFANTAGGDIVIGMAEAKGVPHAFMPFVGDADMETRRLEEIARSGLEPRIRNLRVRAVPLSTGGHVLIIRVPRSYVPPHRVTYKNRNRFWARASSGKYEPNVQELRHLFNEVPRLAERIASFRTDRLVKIAAGETPVPLRAGGKVVVHAVPTPAFADGRLLDLVSAAAAGTHLPLPLDSMGGANRLGINLDGLVNYTDRVAGARQSYALFFRSGVIEGVSELSRRDDDGHPYFVAAEFTQKVVFGVRQYLDVLKSYDAGLPVYVFLSLCDVRQCFYRYAPERVAWVDTDPLGQELVALPEIYVDSFGIDVPTAMRPAFNMLWNAFGFLSCDMYDSDGRWKGAI
jgi:schlafen family protein